MWYFGGAITQCLGNRLHLELSQNETYEHYCFYNDIILYKYNDAFTVNLTELLITSSGGIFFSSHPIENEGVSDSSWRRSCGKPWCALTALRGLHWRGEGHLAWPMALPVGHQMAGTGSSRIMIFSLTYIKNSCIFLRRQCWVHWR